MKKKLSVVYITKNAESTLKKSLESVANLADEIIVADDYSMDRTLEIASDYNAHIYFHHEANLGKRKAFALSKATGTWILILDSDEFVSDSLKREIKKIISANNNSTVAYKVPFQNHFLGRELHHGGENYSMLRFFRKDAVIIAPALVHEEFIPKNKEFGLLKEKIYHYSYRSMGQMFLKFTGYALREAKQMQAQGKKVTLKHVTLYPLHMLWARFIEDKGYKDGLFRLPLDIGFAYMEFMSYVLLFLFTFFSSMKTHKSQKYIKIA